MLCNGPGTLCFYAKNLGKISMGTPPMGATDSGGLVEYVKKVIFQQYLAYLRNGEWMLCLKLNDTMVAVTEQIT